MNAREAKRWACWEAASILRGFIEAGSDFQIPDGADSPDYERVVDGMEELIRELSNRGNVDGLHPAPVRPTESR